MVDATMKANVRIPSCFGFTAFLLMSIGALGASDWVGGFDCLHPNSPGHEKVKDAFVSALAQ